MVVLKIDKEDNYDQNAMRKAEYIGEHLTYELCMGIMNI